MLRQKLEQRLEQKAKHMERIQKERLEEAVRFGSASLGAKLRTMAIQQRNLNEMEQFK